MTAIIRTIAQSAANLGVSLDDAAVDRFVAYYHLLMHWNSQMNLTRVITESDVVAKHFLDSMAIVPHLATARTLVDIGSGAGFPGVPIAIARPDLSVTLVESIKKKCLFLDALARELSLDFKILPVRLETLIAESQTFDVAVSRATLPPLKWIKQGAPLVAPQGLLITMLGRDRPALPTPKGFQPAKTFPYGLPVDGVRALAILKRD